jgi:hypothetical protein
MTCNQSTENETSCCIVVVFVELDIFLYKRKDSFALIIVFNWFD